MSARGTSPRGRRGRALGLLLALAAPAVASEPVPLGPCGPIARIYDAVELPAARLHHLGGTPIARLAMLAFREGRAAPIPFQVDERRGRKFALADGPEPTMDDRPGVLDAEDVLVFMACDAGERRDAAEIRRALANAEPVTGWREIEVRDPVDHTSGFAYLVAAEHPPVSDRRYAAYEAAGDLVRTARYRVGLVSALPTYCALALAGPLGPNLLDGIRMRAEATLHAGLAHWTLNEQQGRHALIAWKAGPVRVIRRSRHQVSIGLGIHLTAGTAHTYFYPQHVYVPGSLKLPFSPGLLFREITAFAGADGRDLRGWRYHAPGVPPRGFLIDGQMDPAERGFDSSGDWFALAHGDEALLFVTRLSENLARAIRLRLVYRDDATHPYPPEASPGTLPLIGYEGRGVERLPGGRYTFALHVFGLTGYRRGDEQRLLARLASPLTADVSAEWPPPNVPNPGGH